MSDDIPRSDPWPEEDADDTYDLDEEAVEDILPEESLDVWGDDMDEFLIEDDLIKEEPIEVDDVNNDLEDSFYEPPPPPVTDAQLESDEPFGDGENWFKANWWRILIIIILVAVIVFLLARACTGKKKKTATTLPQPSPTRVLLSTFTPTPPVAPEQSGSQAPVGGALTGGATESPLTQPTQPPAPTQPPPPPPTQAPSTGGKFTIGQTVVVTGTDKDKLSFRAGPGTKYEIIRLLKDGTRLTVIGGPEKANRHNWWQLKTQNGQVGWAVEDYLEPAQ